MNKQQCTVFYNFHSHKPPGQSRLTSIRRVCSDSLWEYYIYSTLMFIRCACLYSSKFNSKTKRFVRNSNLCFIFYRLYIYYSSNADLNQWRLWRKMHYTWSSESVHSQSVDFGPSMFWRKWIVLKPCDLKTASVIRYCILF